MRISKWIKANAFLFCIGFVLVSARSNAEEDKKAESSGKAVVLCKEHGVPSDICVLCHPKLAAQYKKKGDWCKEHKVPESQCIACHPELEEKYKAMAAGKNPPDEKTEKTEKSDGKTEEKKSAGDAKKE